MCFLEYFKKHHSSGSTKYSDTESNVVVQSKDSDFKGANIVSDRANDYYQNKDKLLSKQYDVVKTGQELLEKQLKEIRLELSKLQDQPKDPVRAVPDSGEQDLLAKLKAELGKKILQRV